MPPRIRDGRTPRGEMRQEIEHMAAHTLREDLAQEDNEDAFDLDYEALEKAEQEPQEHPPEPWTEGRYAVFMPDRTFFNELEFTVDMTPFPEERWTDTTIQPDEELPW